MPAPEAIRKLVETFEQNISDYRFHKNETELRLQFLNPFFEALGWDMNNIKGMDENHKEVAHEFSVEIDRQQKRADYAFRIKGDSFIAQKFDFLVEAKKPSVKIETNVDAAFQIRSYGWSAKLPINILTDFEHFAVYDCRVKPKYGENAVLNRQMLFHYKEYMEKWDEIASLFSPEAIRAGSLSEYVKSIKGKRGTADVDDDFLQEIERWRELLAKNIASRNEWIDISALNYSVQMIIDRIVFLRICEERSIEPVDQLKDITNKENIYKELCSLFKRADTKYNSGLFHFVKESGEASHADDLTLRLVIDDKTLKDIILNLYLPKSPYAFLYIPSDILGQVYERFLGKVIRLTDGNHAKVEEKPEVRKAGGVYYTPTFIVTYIVINTLGKLLLGRTPKEAAKLKIVDPACGSGTFLLGAFEYLLAWYLKWYADAENDPEKWVKNKVLVKVGIDYRLTTAKKKEILLNNIYGVDIDPQAVEVTKLSLLLKVLENASGQLELGMERILPDLGNNIKCGNSLVGEDYFEGRFPNTISDEERKRVNPFDWKTAFPEVFAQGGFDIVVGNPPYRMLQPHNTEIGILEYLRKKYLVAEFKMEMFHTFLQLGVSILKQGGMHGFIIPSTILNNVYAENLRSWITGQCAIQKICVANEKVFEDADVHTLVLVLKKEDNTNIRKNTHIQITTQLNESGVDNLEPYSETKQEYFDSLSGAVWNILIDDKNAELILRLSKKFPSLSEVSTINRGLITGDRDKYFSNQKASNEYVPILAGSDVNRYMAKEPSEFVLFKKPKGSGGSWDADMHLAPHKILVRQIGTKPMASLIKEPIAVTGNLFTIRAKNIEEELYILGIFNSKLIEFFWKIMFSDFKNSFPQVTIFSISQVPIHAINFNDPAEKAMHDKMVSLVESMLALHKSLASAQSPHEKERLERQIRSTDEGIDELVYELYGLSEDEVKMVERK